MKVLITGASGFIGSFLVEEALNRGMQVWAGIRTSSNRQYLQDKRINFINLDFDDKEKLRQTLSKFAAEHEKWDYIIHNAGLTKSLNPDDFKTVNYEYTRNFVCALQQTNLTPAKFLLMSSLSAAPAPDTQYGKSKLLAEDFLKTVNDFPYLIFRPTGVYGPRDKDYFLMLKTILSGFDFAAGFEKQKLTFIYVKDLARAAFLALESAFSRKTYNIADGDVYSDSEYTEIARKALGRKQIVRIRIPLFVLKAVCLVSQLIGTIRKQAPTLNLDKYKILRRRDWTCDTREIKNDLNFSADYRLKEGIEECVNWYRENEWL